MHNDLNKIQKEFTCLILVALTFPPVLGLLMAITFNVSNADSILNVILRPEFYCYYFIISILASIFFLNILRPIYKWIGHEDYKQEAPQQLYKRLSLFTVGFWGVHLFYALTCPLLIIYLQNGIHNFAISHKVITFIVLQCITSYLVAMPIYISILNKLGRLVKFLGLKGVFFGFKLKFWHVGAIIPIVTVGLITAHFIQQTGFWAWSSLLLFVIITGSLICTTWLTANSVRNSLIPIKKLFNRSGVVTHANLAGLRAQSTDEIAYLTYTIAKTFARLIDQKSYMQTVVDSAAEGIIVLNRQGHIQTFNRAAEKLFGYSGQEAQQLSVYQLLPELIKQSTLAQLENLGEQETHGIHLSGKKIPMAVRISCMQISGTNMYTCLIADITERKAALLKQKNAEARYRDLVETAHDLVWSIDAHGKWTYLNKAAEHLYGLEPEKMIGTDISKYRDPDYAKQESIAFKQILNGKELYQFETVHLDKTGQPLHLSFNARAHRSPNGKISKISGTARDITEKKQFEELLTFQAEHDVLTKLYNRRYFQQELERVIARTTRNGNSCGILYIDLDQFKYINDSLGHAAGDRLLIEVSKTLSEKLREGEILARFGGDEFTVLLYNIKRNKLLSAAEKFKSQLNNYRFLHKGKSIRVACSIGAALIDKSISSVDEAMAHADFACHLAKSKGKNCIQVYDPHKPTNSEQTIDTGLSARVREMLANNQFIQMFQPIALAKNSSIYGYEVLIRMPGNEGQLIMPSAFIESAKRFGLIQNIDRWMIQQAINKLGSLHEHGNKTRMFINLCNQSFEDPDLIPTVKRCLERTKLNPKHLVFEVSESDLVQKLSIGTQFIHKIKEIGCLFALDAFGFGHSSLNYLKHLPVDLIKIEGSFIQSVLADKIEQAMVKSILLIANSLNIKTVAECVENSETYEYLKSIGVDYMQGHYLGKPTQTLDAIKHTKNCEQLSA